ncbi:PAS domain S-box-containing protein/diguanylate cyclase (GGDEF) domain-containing protein [Abditibacterium utsteinense]|uniref:diguanylate cyclase n=1 Tax=Abditibacterium utsteinense TaxID=1960156 RepID=A0A2S8ST38_9BACT|nr:diguanylate cyclase [Abditibacterium utsteinense]PQV63928.1 PAS domain S-box-containing protein/diguanylate cyclase (GGDEF) domain-containing protein [Abditibacterium utsteinense]
MNKRISQLVAIGFAILILLGLTTNVFLTWAVQQSLTEVRHIEATAIEARAATRSLRSDYLERGSAIATALLDPSLSSKLPQFLARKQKSDDIITTHLKTASERTQNEDLLLLLNRLRAHEDDVSQALELQLFRLATTDVRQAREFYIARYLPTQQENIKLSEAALKLATQDVVDLQKAVEIQSSFSQLVAQRAILLFLVLGLGSGFFLTRSVSAIVRKAEQAAHANRNMLEYSRDVICSIDEEGRFVDVSPACQKIWGYSAQELKGRRFQELLHPDDLAKTTEAASTITSGTPVKDFENRYLCKDGSIVDMLWSAHWSDLEKSMFCVAHDISERKEAQEKLRTLAMYDGLTGLLNRTAILECLTSEMERAARESKPLSVVLLDLDHFKQVNDLHGHAAGDAVLKEAAQRMKNSMRGYDKVGRYGGEEFLIVAPGCGGQDSVTLAERVRSCIASNCIETSDGPLDVTCSLGAAVARAAPREEADALIARADGALYCAKAGGRNRTEVAKTPDDTTIP